MKKPVIIIVVLFIAAILVINGFQAESSADRGDWKEGIQWSEPSMTQESVIARDKPVYLFVSTEWCTYCKKMKNNTFTDEKVQTLLNELFTVIYINPEKQGTARFTGEELSYADLARNLGVNGYPANYFFEPGGKLIGGQPGYLDAKMFADLAEYIGDDHYKSYTFTKFRQLPGEQRRQ